MNGEIEMAAPVARGNLTYGPTHLPNDQTTLSYLLSLLRRLSKAVLNARNREDWERFLDDVPPDSSCRRAR